MLNLRKEDSYMNDLHRSVKLICPLCGNDGFVNVDEECDDLVSAPGSYRMKCADCGTVYTKDEIISANSLKIENATDEMMQDVMDDLTKQIKKAFK